MAPLTTKCILISLCLTNANLAAWHTQKAPGSRNEEHRLPAFSSSGSWDTVSSPLQEQTRLRRSRGSQWQWLGTILAQVNLASGAQAV